VTGRQKRIAMYLIVVIVAALIAYFGGVWIKGLRPGRTIADSELETTIPRQGDGSVKIRSLFAWGRYESLRVCFERPGELD
jgi:hypothetical protein